MKVMNIMVLDSNDCVSDFVRALIKMVITITFLGIARLGVDQFCEQYLFVDLVAPYIRVAYDVAVFYVVYLGTVTMYNTIDRVITWTVDRSSMEDVEEGTC